MSELKTMDAATFKECFHLYFRYCCMLCIGILKEHAIAEDLAQDAFVEAYTKNIPKRKMKAFLSKCVMSRAKNVYRHVKDVRKNEYGVILRFNTYTSDNVLEHMIKAELLHRIYRVIEAMPDRRKECFKLTYFDGLSFAQVAFHLSISLNTVKEHNNTALKYLRNKFGSNFKFSTAGGVHAKQNSL